MGGVIRFEQPEAFEEHNDNVVQILDNNNIPEGSYPATRSFPPIYFVPELEEGNPAVPELRELDGVNVDIQEDDE
ncbi:hypothetical protein VI817_007976 [Penicillium citrinum]|uniref:Uncharacterized protein n=1 Tax=Penicillium hetheringtonii TaxID=911720 RepID=A0AAD6DC85_9EURO|nr:hypothetical protein N7450_010147 [Penicillium hetheringtonii]KAK5790689.1 hypothetical protein VI817_007976 [Penicillium citrinum]